VIPVEIDGAIALASVAVNALVAGFMLLVQRRNRHLLSLRVAALGSTLALFGSVVFALTPILALLGTILPGEVRQLIRIVALIVLPWPGLYWTYLYWRGRF